MFCPKCGNQVDLFADKCLSCGKSFKNMSLAEKEKLNRAPAVAKRMEIPKRIKRKVKSHMMDSRKTPSTSPTARVEYNNGYAVVEGMSIKGTRMKKGSFKRRNNNEGCGFSFPVNSLDHY